ncbi:MAG: hypothetical protein ACLTE2_10020 [Eubacteriales bacterium]
MANIYKKVLQELIGGTPLLESNQLRKETYKLNAKILAKLQIFQSGR